jgi:CHAD domain-containing protein
MLGHAPLARPEAGPVGVHQMRVALRRLRSVLRLFRPVADGASLRGIDAALRDLARLLGPARDWDVFQAGLGAELPEAFPEPRMQALSRAAEAERLSGYAALRKHVEGPGFRTLAWHAVTALRLRPWRLEQEEPEAVALRAAPVRDFAGQVLDKRRKKLLEMGEDIEALDAEALHELRLEGKRLRYAAELFAPLWPGKAARRFLGRLSELQDGLGVANDTAVARALVNGLATREAGRAWAIGVAEGYAAARGGVARKEAHRLWDRLVDAETFWHRTSPRDS